MNSLRLGLALLGALLMACGGNDGAISLPVDLTPEPMFIEGKCMAWDGEAYTVAWIGRIDDTGDIYAARLSPLGQLLSGPERLYQGVEEQVSHCQLIPDGDRYQLLFQVSSLNTHEFVFFANGSTQGSPREFYTGSRAHSVTMRDGAPSVLRTGTGTIDGSTQHYLRVEADAIADPPTIAPNSDKKYDPYFTWRAEEDAYLAIWRRSSRVRFARIEPDGSYAGTEERFFDNGNSQGGPVHLIATGDGNMWTAWVENDQWMFLPADTTGAPIWTEPQAILPPNRAASPGLRMIHSDVGDFVIWRGDQETPLAQIYAGRLDSAAGAVVDVQLLTDPNHEYRLPETAASPDGFAVLFEGRVAGSERIYWTNIAP